MPVGTPGPESTPGRRTRVTIGYMPEVVTQMPFIWERWAPEIANGTQGFPGEVKFVDGIGLRLAAYQDDIVRIFERASAQDKWLRGVGVQVADNWNEQYVSRQYDYPGLNYTDAGAATTAPLYEKQVPAGETWEKTLAADQLAFSSPDTSDDPTNMDRVFRTTNAHSPDHAVYVLAYVPWNRGRGGNWGTIMFTGPAGFNSAGYGTGQYAAKMTMGGLLKLYERCKTGADFSGRVWIQRNQFQILTDPGPDEVYYLAIESDASESCESSRWRGSRIAFRSYQVELIRYKGFTDAARAIVEGGLDGKFSRTKRGVSQEVYKVPLELVNPPELEPLRLDFRRDVRGLFGVSNASFPHEVEWHDDPFALTLFPTPLVAIQVEWFGDFPAGTSCDIRLINVATGFEIPLDSEGGAGEGLINNDCQGGVRKYKMVGHNPLHRLFKARIKFTSTGDATPTLVRYRVVRRGTIQAQGLEVLTFPTARAAGTASLPRQEIVDMIDIDDGTDDPIQEAATVVIADFTAEMPEIGNKVRQPVDIVLMTIPSGADPPEIFSKLARFYINPNRSKQIRGKRWSAYDPTMHGGDGGYPAQEAQYPKDGSRRYTLTGNGEATRLKSMLFPQRWSLIDIPNAGDITQSMPMRVTDGLATAFEFAGYSPERIDVPDHPVRFFAAEDNSSDMIVEPYSEIYQWVVETARDYLGGWPLFDLNAGADGPLQEAGMWRILKQRKPPYNILMRFTGEHPGALKVPHILKSYPYDTFVGEPFDGQITPHNFIDGDAELHIEPPEGNCVLVQGGTQLLGVQVLGFVHQFIFNPVSCNFFNLEADHPKYPDENSPDFMGGDAVPIVVCDATLVTKEAVNWVGRRVFDYACFAREYLVFHAPLTFVNDVTDPFQRYPRRLRFGDVVEVQQPGLDEEGAPIWKKYLCVRCSPSYSRDGYQFAKYELVSSSALERFGMPVGMFDFFTLEELRRKALYRRQGRSYRSNHLRTVNRKVELGASAMMALPAGALAPIQNIDPESPNFGKFNFMPDYDPIP